VIINYLLIITQHGTINGELQSREVTYYKDYLEQIEKIERL